ncbi:MAG: alpha/beta hydrolase-fold protein [Bacteroidales bacterium]|nr:alpha/beta hydrolase-fold protein [Bacteroidales bacterium]
MKEEIIDIGGRACHFITTDAAPVCVVVKPLCTFERRLLHHEFSLTVQEAGCGFVMCAFEVEEPDLRPEGVDGTFGYLQNALLPAVEARYATLPLIVGGYSLGGLFALWSATKSRRFTAVAACSPSLWMPGWEEYYAAHPTQAKYIYMSLGVDEEKTRKMPYRLVGDCCRRQHQRHVEQLGPDCCHLRWHEGDHFTHSEHRKATAFAWCIKKVMSP